MVQALPTMPVPDAESSLVHEYKEKHCTHLIMFCSFAMTRCLSYEWNFIVSGCPHPFLVLKSRFHSSRRRMCYYSDWPKNSPEHGVYETACQLSYVLLSAPYLLRRGLP